MKLIACFCFVILLVSAVFVAQFACENGVGEMQNGGFCNKNAAFGALQCALKALFCSEAVVAERLLRNVDISFVDTISEQLTSNRDKKSEMRNSVVGIEGVEGELI